MAENPRFGNKKLTEIRREQIKQFLSELPQATQEIDDVIVP
jgi:hypothetical protein